MLRYTWACAVVAGLWLGGLEAGEKGGFQEENVIGDLVRVGRALFGEGEREMAQGNREAALGRLEAALGKFQEALKLDDTNKLANQYFARIEAYLGHYKSAIDALRKLQKLRVPISNEDMQTTLRGVTGGVLQLKDLKERGELLLHLRETLLGLPVEEERQIDAHLMGIYAKLGEKHLHDIVKERFFAIKPVPAEVHFLAAKTYLLYDVNQAQAASYLEQAVDSQRAIPIRPSGNPERDQLNARIRDAGVTVAEDFLAYAYYAAKILDAPKNRFVAAEQNPKTTFADVTEAAGLKDVISPRVAVGDYDGDGLEDLCACGRVFKNVDGKRFKEVTKELGIASKGVIVALWLDYDGDGRLDLLCASFPKVRLWRNRGDGTFTDATADAGLDYAFPGPPEALAACDYDGDGRLDLFIGCFEHPDPQRAALGQPAFLFHNAGRGRFEDVTQASGISAGGNYCARGAAWGDFNNDGRPDLYVANYRLQPNQLWVNRGGRFTDAAAALGVRGTPGTGQYALAFGHSVAATWGDLDNDGNLDLGVTNIASTRYLEFSDPLALYINGGKKDGWHFQDIIWTSGIRFEEMATDMGFCDIDNDGDLDILLTAMFKERPTALYQNVGSNKFQAVTWRSGLLAFNAWGQAWFDKDNDGDMDVVVGSAEGLRLFENKMGESSWLRVQLVGKRSNAFGIGSRVTVIAGALTQIREITCGSGTSSQSSAIAHFGLGSYKGTAEITVRWPDGHEQRLPASPINKLLKIEEQ